MEETDFLLIVFVLYALIIADIITTTYGVWLGGTELNPLFYAHGFKDFAFFKVGFGVATVMFSVGAYRYLHSRKSLSYAKATFGLLVFFIVFLIIFYAITVTNNLLVIWRL